MKFDRFINTALPGLAVAVAYLIIYFIGINISSDMSYTYEWSARSVVPIFAVTSILFAAFNRHTIAISSTVGCVLGIILGHVIGDSHYEWDAARHKEWALQPGYVQQSDPTNIGWLVCIVTYLLAIIVGLVLQTYKARKRVSAENGGQRQK